MTTVMLKGMATRKLRSLLSALAVVLGVALMSGSYILTDTIEQAYASILTTSYAHTDAVVTARPATGDMGGREAVPAALLTRVRALPEVEEAAGTLVDFSGSGDVVLLDDGGDRVKARGPTFAFGIDPAAARFNPFELAQGRWAAGAGEVVVDTATAKRRGFSLGDRVAVLAQGKAQRFSIVGLSRFRGTATAGSATAAVFDVETAQRLHQVDGFYAIAVAGKPGVSGEALEAAIRSVLPAGAQVRSGRQQAAEDLEATSFVGVVRSFLVAFSGIALLVGAFVIVNTLSITVAARTRELATLRMLGATRRQVCRSVVLEGLVLGVMASLVGLGAGLVTAEGLRVVFDVLGVELPDAQTVFRTRTAVVSVSLGILVTCVASLVPAVRATRVTPLAAIRDAHTPKGQRSRRAARAALVLLAAAAGLVATASGGQAETNVRLLLVLSASVAAFAGAALMTPRLVRPLAAVLVRPLAFVGGPAAELARANVMRNAGRTATTAAALMVGVTLATLSGIFASSVLASGETAVREQVNAEYLFSSGSWGRRASDVLSRTVASATGISAAATIRTIDGGATLPRGPVVSVTGADPGIERLYRFDWTQAPAGRAALLGTHAALVDRALAEARGWAVGDRFVLRTHDGEPVDLVIRGIFQAAPFDSLLGQVVMPQDLFGRTFPAHVGALTLVRADSRDAVESLVQALPGAAFTTPAQIAQARHSELMSVLRLLYVLLGVAVLVSVLGMVNTLVLATFERTREIGVLRAVGMTRRQIRRMTRYEGVLTASIGGVLGVAVGIASGAAVIMAIDQQAFAFSVPVDLVVGLAASTALLGVVAAVLPARRAARLDVLQALQHD